MPDHSSTEILSRQRVGEPGKQRKGVCVKIPVMGGAEQFRSPGLVFQTVKNGGWHAIAAPPLLTTPKHARLRGLPRGIRKAFTAPGQPVTKQVLFGSLVRRLGLASM